jgi:hypothetical protein
LNTEGVARITRAYDAYGNFVEEAYFDDDGKQDVVAHSQNRTFLFSAKVKTLVRPRPGLG